MSKRFGDYYASRTLKHLRPRSIWAKKKRAGSTDYLFDEFNRPAVYAFDDAADLVDRIEPPPDRLYVALQGYAVDDYGYYQEEDPHDERCYRRTAYERGEPCHQCCREQYQRD